MNQYQFLAKFNRPEFEIARRDLQSRQRKLSGEFIKVPQDEIDDMPGNQKKPAGVWRNRYFMVQLFLDLFNEGTPEFQEYGRLTINRCELENDGNWRDDITWDELMAVKEAIGFGGVWAVEVYPPADHVVDVSNMRHLFITAKPIFAWEKKQAPAILLEPLDAEPVEEAEKLPAYDRSHCTCFQNPPCSYCSDGNYDPESV